MLYVINIVWSSQSMVPKECSYSSSEMRSRFLYPLLLGGSLAGYFLMFKKRKDVDYVLDGREQRMEEGRAASEKFRTHMQQKLHGTSGSRRDEQQEH
eukprot:gene6003-9128_t